MNSNIMHFYCLMARCFIRYPLHDFASSASISIKKLTNVTRSPTIQIFSTDNEKDIYQTFALYGRLFDISQLHLFVNKNNKGNTLLHRVWVANTGEQILALGLLESIDHKQLDDYNYSLAVNNSSFTPDINMWKGLECFNQIKQTIRCVDNKHIINMEFK